MSMTMAVITLILPDRHHHENAEVPGQIPPDDDNAGGKREDLYTG